MLKNNGIIFLISLAHNYHNVSCKSELSRCFYISCKTGLSEHFFQKLIHIKILVSIGHFDFQLSSDVSLQYIRIDNYRFENFKTKPSKV